jgi:hypothetical protein
MNGWIWKSKQLLLHARVISKPATSDNTKLSVTRDIYNPLLWSVGLQTNSGFHTISVHHSRYGAVQKIHRIKGSKSMIQSQRDEGDQ